MISMENVSRANFYAEGSNQISQLQSAVLKCWRDRKVLCCWWVWQFLWVSSFCVFVYSSLSPSVLYYPACFVCHRWMWPCGYHPQQCEQSGWLTVGECRELYWRGKCNNTQGKCGGIRSVLSVSVALTFEFHVSILQTHINNTLQIHFVYSSNNKIYRIFKTLHNLHFIYYRIICFIFLCFFAKIILQFIH